MKREIVIAAALSAVFHVGFLFAGGMGTGENADKVIDHGDLDLVTEKAPPPPPVKSDSGDEKAEVNDDVLLPEDLLASGLSETQVSSVAIDALTQFVKPENVRPPRPDALTVGIPSGAQKNNGQRAAAGLVFKVEDLDHVPTPRYKQAPNYPFDMKQAHLEGVVELMLIVDTTGRVIDVSIISSTNPSFENNALEAARKWKFEPGTKDGTPVSFKMHLPIKFNLTK
jgi:periplasmic protein TonB